jgi:hypothetical protein
MFIVQTRPAPFGSGQVLFMQAAPENTPPVPVLFALLSNKVLYDCISEASSD